MREELGSREDARELVRVLLREALDDRLRGRAPADGARVRVRAVCDGARRVGLPIERVLVAMKEEWREASPTLRLPRHEAAEVLDRLVTLCIDEFFSRPR